MSEFVYSGEKVVKKGEDIGITIPKPVASISFNALDVGTYQGVKVFSDPSKEYGKVELR